MAKTQVVKKVVKRVKAVEEEAPRRKRVVEEAPQRKTRTAPAKPKTLKEKRAEKESLAAGKKRVGKVIEKVVTEAKKIRKTMAEAPAKATARKTRKTEVEEVEEETPKRSKMHTAIADALDDMLDGIEKDYSLSGTSMDPTVERLSTSSLVLDLILSKGIIPGWYTVFGPEQSCKSTAATTFMGAALNTDVPIISYWDYEGSSSSDYISNILEVSGINMTIEQIFGVRDPKTSHWSIKPRVRFYAEGVAEKFFDYLAKLERTLPDKVTLNEKWYLVYEDTKINRKIVGDEFDKNYWRKSGKLRIEAEDGSLQALVIVDSYPAMLPEKQDVDDPNSAIAMQARMFSEQIKRVKGKLRAKRIAVIGVNQLRKVPMAMYGPTESEPCGEALKFFSDVRLKFTPRSLSGVPEAKGKGMLEEEKSITGSGVDTYRYIHVRAQKNKLSTPNLEGWMRLWITDANGEGRGFDPMWDTYRYLKETNQVVGKRNAFRFTIKGKETKQAITWMQLKVMVIGTAKQNKAVCEEIGLKPFRIRDFCKKQLASGVGIDLYFDAKKAGASKDDEEESEDSDD